MIALESAILLPSKKYIFDYVGCAVKTLLDEGGHHHYDTVTAVNTIVNTHERRMKRNGTHELVRLLLYKKVNHLPST